MKLCPKCGTQYPDDANFCPVDAARLVAAATGGERSASAAAAAQEAAGGGHRGEVETRTEDGRRVIGGRFVLGERIGGRQTGEVYDALQRSDGRACVVKLVDAVVFPRSLVRQRTERELGKLARLDNPGIAKVLGYGRRESSLWIACERVPGCRSLLDIVFDDGPMAPQRAAAIVVEVGKALSEAAKVGVIHRDLAPKNVLLGSGGALKLINFGVTVPSTPRVQGVPEFVAPEIIEGKPVDQRANIYSLGALFYYLVAGRPPYMGEPEEVYERHLSGEPEPPSVHLESVPEAVDAVILRALERTSSRRFMTLRQLLNDVERIVAGEEPMTTTTMGHLMARGKGKSKKLAQTMVGGFQIASGAGARAGKSNGESERAAQAAASQPGESSPGAALAAMGANSSEPGAAGSPAVSVSGTLGEQAPAGDHGRSAGASAAAAAGEPEAGATAASAAGPTEAAAGESGGEAGRAAASGFRETGWFEDGASARATAEGPETAQDQSRGGSALGERDRARYSLKTGATEVMPRARRDRDGADSDVPSRELIDEMKGGRGKVIAALVLAFLMAAALIAYAVLS